MTHPTTAQLDALLDQIRITDRRSLTATLHAAIERDRIGGTNTPDGYPTSSNGGRRGNNPLTSVEAAAARLARPERDPLNENLTQALGYLHQAVASINALQHRVANLVQLMGVPQPIRCEVLLDADADHYGDVGGRLHRPHHLSRAAYDFVVSRGRLPSEAEREEYRRYGTWQRRMRVTP